jgi:prevent-host-death family protein
MLQVPVSEAKSTLTALVREAEKGNDVILTRNGRSVARITATTAKSRKPLTIEEKMQIIRDIQKSARGKFEPGFDSARSADFLYGDDGMPG